MERQDNYVKEISESLYEIGAIKIGNFKLKSGDFSPFYIDLRIIPSFPRVFRKVIEGYCAQFNSIYQNRRDVIIGGIMSAGIPFATALCLEFELPLIQIRSEPKKHGTGKLVEGRDKLEGREVLLVDDLISTGASKVKPKRAVEDLGGECKHLLVFIDRTSSKSRESIADIGLELHSCLRIGQILEALSLSDRIPSDELNLLQKAIQDWL